MKRPNLPVARIVFYGSVMAALAGAVTGAPGIPGSWATSWIIAIIPFFILGLLPLYVLQAILGAIARRRNKSFSKNKFWLPGLFYIALSGYCGNLMGFAFVVASQHKSGSEFMPLIVIGFWIYTFWVVDLVAILFGIVSMRNPKQPVLLSNFDNMPPSVPTSTEPAKKPSPDLVFPASPAPASSEPEGPTQPQS